MEDKTEAIEWQYDPGECDVKKLHAYIDKLHKIEYMAWKDFKTEKPEIGQSVIVLTKYGMHFYQYVGYDQLTSIYGLFYIPRQNSCAGLRYSVDMTDITHWQALPVAYE